MGDSMPCRTVKAEAKTKNSERPRETATPPQTPAGTGAADASSAGLLAREPNPVEKRLRDASGLNRVCDVPIFVAAPTLRCYGLNVDRIDLVCDARPLWLLPSRHALEASFFCDGHKP